MCWHHIGNKCCLFFWLFCQLFDKMCPIVSLPYSLGTPNTCLALTEQFDLSPCVVIGGPGLVIHGPFGCWHVKCSVPIPKAESWFAGSFFSPFSVVWPLTQELLLAFDTPSSSSRCLWLTLRNVWSQTSFWDGEKNDSNIKYFKCFPQISGLSSVSCACLLFCYVLKSFLFVLEAQRCS